MADTIEKLTKVLLNFAYETNGHICDGCGDHCLEDACKEIANHLVSQGALLPPVKIGQKVYTIPRSAIREWTVVGVWISTDPKCSYAHIYWEQNGHHMESRAVLLSDLGKTVYTTHEEAEKALTERKP